jgi:hypothetical protein
MPCPPLSSVEGNLLKDRAVVYTALFGPHDDLKEQPSIAGIDYVCFTDQSIEPRGWDLIRKSSSLPDRLAAKDPKMRPHRWVRKWRWSIWIDASVQILSSDFPEIALGSLNDGIALFVHPDRDCIYAEAEASKPMEKYDPVLIDAQVARYRADGFPETAGLWACGVIARDRRPSNRRLGREWFKRCQDESVQDQISLPPLLQAIGIRPGVIPGNLWDNRLIRVGDHLRAT